MLSAKAPVQIEPKRRVDIEGTREHRQPRPQRALRFSAQVVAPADRVAQRPVPPVGHVVPVVQQRQPGGKPRGELGEWQRFEPDGGELDREGDAVEPLAELNHVSAVRVGDGEPGHGGSGPQHEKLDRVAGGCRLHAADGSAAVLQIQHAETEPSLRRFPPW